MLYGRGRKVLTLWGGRERSSSDSSVGPDRPGEASLSSWPVLVLLALDNKRELKGRQAGKAGKQTKKKADERKVSWGTWHQDPLGARGRAAARDHVDASRFVPLVLTSPAGPACGAAVGCRRKGTSLSCHREFHFNHSILRPTRSATVSSFFFYEAEGFDGGPPARPGIPAAVPPGSLVLAVVPPVSGLGDEQGDVVAGQKVQQASSAPCAAPWQRSRSVSKHGLHVCGQRQHPGKAAARWEEKQL